MIAEYKEDVTSDIPQVKNIVITSGQIHLKCRLFGAKLTFIHYVLV